MTRRKDGLWQEAVMINGKRKYFYGKTKAEVLKKINEYTEKQKIGKTFVEVANEFKKWHEAQSAHKTWECYLAPFKRLSEAFSDNPINSITPKQINEFVANLVKKQYSKRTVAAHVTLCRMIFDYAILNGYCESNPATFIKIPTGLKVTHRELPEENDIEKIKQNKDGFALLPFFILYTGCRRGEALAIRYEDFDFEKNEITISKSLYYDNNKPVIKEPKTEKGKRKVPLLNPLKEALPKNKKGFVFGNEDGQPISLSAFQKRFAKYQRETGITSSLHQLRHAYATILYDAGIDEKLAQEILGHSSIVTTRNIYTHIKESKIQEATNKLNAVL